MSIEKEEDKTKIVKWDYDYTFLYDLLKMFKGYFCVIYNDKKLKELYTALEKYVDSRLPEIGGEIIDFDISITYKK